MGPRRSLDCEWIDTPIDQVEGALRAGSLVLALVGQAGQLARGRTVQVLSANGHDGQMMVQDIMYNDTAYQLLDPKRSVLRVVIFSNPL